MFLSQGVRDQSRTPESQGLHGGRKCQLLSRRRRQPAAHTQSNREPAVFQPFLGLGAKPWAQTGSPGLPGSERTWHHARSLLWGTHPFPTPEREHWASQTPGHSPPRPARLLNRPTRHGQVGSHRPPIKIFLEQICEEGSLPFPLTPGSTISYRMALLGSS